MNNRFPDLEVLCRGYETEEEPIIILSVTQEEIEYERSKQADIFSDGYLESVCLYRKLAYEILRYDTFLLHASVLEVDGNGYGFMAPSGTGKTTQTRLWLQHFGDRARVINGDKPLVRVMKDSGSTEFVAYGTPWCGKEKLSCNASVPLKALFLLERALEPSCELASQEYSVDHIFHQLLMPQAFEQMELLLSMIDVMIETVPVYVLRCNMKEESVVTAWEAVNK